MGRRPSWLPHLEGLVERHGVAGAARALGVSVRTVRRRLRRGPSTPPVGLTIEQAREVRRLYWSDLFTQAQLAEEFGVSQSMVARIVNNKAFREDPVGTLSGSADVVLGVVDDKGRVREVAGRGPHDGDRPVRGQR